jgi:hypothetical protein
LTTYDHGKSLKIGTLSVHVSAHGDCTVAKGFNQYSVACKNFKRLMFKTVDQLNKVRFIVCQMKEK